MEKAYEYEYTFKKYLLKENYAVPRDRTVNYLEIYLSATDKVSRKIIDDFFAECFANELFRYLGCQITDEGTILLCRLLDKLFKKEFLDKHYRGAYIKLTWKGLQESFSAHREVTKKEAFLRNSY